MDNTTKASPKYTEEMSQVRGIRGLMALAVEDEGLWEDTDRVLGLAGEAVLGDSSAPTVQILGKMAELMRPSPATPEGLLDAVAQNYAASARDLLGEELKTIYEETRRDGPADGSPAAGKCPASPCGTFTDEGFGFHRQVGDLTEYRIAWPAWGSWAVISGRYSLGDADSDMDYHIPQDMLDGILRGHGYLSLDDLARTDGPGWRGQLTCMVAERQFDERFEVPRYVDSDEEAARRFTEIGVPADVVAGLMATRGQGYGEPPGFSDLLERAAREQAQADIDLVADRFRDGILESFRALAAEAAPISPETPAEAAFEVGRWSDEDIANRLELHGIPAERDIIEAVRANLADGGYFHDRLEDLANELIDDAIGIAAARGATPAARGVPTTDAIKGALENRSGAVSRASVADKARRPGI